MLVKFKSRVGEEFPGTSPIFVHVNPAHVESAHEIYEKDGEVICTKISMVSNDAWFIEEPLEEVMRKLNFPGADITRH